MRKYLFLSLFLTLTVSLWGKHVPEQQAGRAAATFMRARTSLAVSVRSIEPGGDGPSYYVINLNPRGWVIVSADDVATPILGYSPTGSLQADRMPDNMRGLLDGYESQIREIASLTSEPHPDWVSAGALTRAVGGPVVEPLIQVNWNQSAPYNERLWWVAWRWR